MNTSQTPAPPSADDASPGPPDARAFRDALGCFATGITVITCVSTTGEPVGVTVNSFNAVSLAPPLVLWSLSREAFNRDAFLASPVFAVNVLAADQQALSDRFAQPRENDWKGVDHAPGETGCAILAGVAASFDCEVHATHDGGDHLVVVGAVRGFRFDPDRRPLLYHRGRYALLADPAG